MNPNLISITLPDIYQKSITDGVTKLKKEKFVERIWKKDYTLWSDSPNEIINRLDWMTVGEETHAQRVQIDNLLASFAKDKISNVYILGMGGSSLAPDVFSHIFSSSYKVFIIDTTDPSRISDLENEMPLESSVFIVATKSGGTAETLSLFKYFYQKVSKISKSPGKSFVAITDPGSRLEEMAIKFSFRKIFLNNPNIGGRYSVLSFFGMVPAAISGADYISILEKSNHFFNELKDEDSKSAFDSLLLASMMAKLSLEGVDKLTFIIPQEISILAEWIEQLIAESTGKNGKGILPVIGEMPSTPDAYKKDRVFVNYSFAGKTPYNDVVKKLIDSDYPIINIDLASLEDLGVHFGIWEFATAAAGFLMEIQPFNQPNVESAKISAKKMISFFKDTGELPPMKTELLSQETIETFLFGLSDNAYVSIHAYVNPNEAYTKVFRKLQNTLRDKTKCATTFGFGPRFLHSTGQLHKGDGGNGVFMQFITKNDLDLAIPDEAEDDQSQMSFGVLKTSQALGDGQALKDANRKLITFVLADNDIKIIENIL